MRFSYGKKSARKSKKHAVRALVAGMCDTAGDIALLECADTHHISRLLEHRLARGRPYTMCRGVCVSVNPMQWLPLYTAELQQRYAAAPTPTRTPSRTNPAHVYTVAETAHVLSKCSPQTIVITGDSGSGKTEVSRICMDYIAARSLSGVVRLQVDRSVRTGTVLEYIGNAQTVRNGNSSRFGKLTQLCHMPSGDVVTRVDTYLLERIRAVHTDPAEGNFRIFYAVLNDVELRAKYALYPIRSDVLGQPYSAVPCVWLEFHQTCKLLGFAEQELEHIASVFVGMLFLMIRDYASAAGVLGLSVATLTTTLANRRTLVGDEVYWTECTSADTRRRTKTLIMGLYHHLFQHIVTLTNESHGDSTLHTSALNVLDIFGFEVLQSNGLEQLCINYCNECMQDLFMSDMVVMQQREYLKEGVDWTMVAQRDDPDIMSLCSAHLFPLLDEACQLKLTSAVFENSVRSGAPQGILFPRIPSATCSFTIQHYAQQVSYSAAHFLERNIDDVRPEICEMVQASSIHRVADLFPPTNQGGGCSSSGDARSKSVVATFHVQMKTLCAHIAAGGMHYVRCIRPSGSCSREFDRRLVERQIVCSGLVEACAVMRAGFEIHMLHAVFLCRYPRVGALLRRRAQLFANNEGVWGATRVFMSSECAERVRRYDAAVRIRTLLRSCSLRVATARRIQASVRLFSRRRRRSVCYRLRVALTSRDAWIQDVSQQLALHVPCHAQLLEALPEVWSKFARVSELRAAMWSRDAWIFRAKLLLL